VRNGRGYAQAGSAILAGHGRAPYDARMSGAMKRVRRRILLASMVCLALLPVILLVAPVGLVFWAWRPVRDRGTMGFYGEAVRWNGGEVGLCDHSTFPGSYWWKVEWHGRDGQRKVLLEIGNDNTPSLEAGTPDGPLEVWYHRQDPESMRYDVPMLATFGSLEDGPVIAEDR